MPRGNGPNPCFNIQFGVPINWQALVEEVVTEHITVQSQPEVQNQPQPPPYDAGYYRCPPIPTLTAGRVRGYYGLDSTCDEVNTKDNTKEEVKVKVTAKDVTVCASCGSHNLTETPDPMVAKECLACGSLMLVDGDVLQMAV